jgi:hypothetical protein
MPEDPNLLTETDEITPEIDKKPEEQQPPAPPTIDYEKKFADSTRENQILQSKLDAQERDRQDLTKEPTDSDLRTAFPEWDTLTDFEKRSARLSYDAQRTAAMANQSVRQLQDERAWNTGIELAVSSDPALQGKEQAFRQFASKPQYKGVSMDVLIPAFLHKNGGAPAAPAPTPKSGLETGNGGPRAPEKPKTLSIDDLSTLRQANPRAYQEYIRNHKAEDFDL